MYVYCKFYESSISLTDLFPSAFLPSYSTARKESQKAKEGNVDIERERASVAG